MQPVWPHITRTYPDVYDPNTLSRVAMTQPLVKTDTLSVSLPATAASSANQVTELASLASIDATLSATLITALDSDSAHNPLYLGTAAKGSATGAAAWQIRKFTIDANNNVSAIRYANGSAVSDQVWDNRASLSYS